jgi:predicted DNA-binding transcriptional regulator AlpA
MNEVLKKYMEQGLLAFSIPQVCECVQISTPTYYKLRAQGLGPKELRMSGSVVRVSLGALQEWIEMLENSDNSKEQKAKLKERSQNALAGYWGNND